MKKLTLIFAALGFLMSCNTDSDDLASPGIGMGESIIPRSTKVFHATLQSTLNLDPAIPFTLCSGDLPEFAIPDHFLSGNATHLGKLNAALSTLHHENCNISFATATLTASVSGQLTGANGDLIYYTGDDVIDIYGLLTGTSATGSINGNWTITGGTGRFNGASGSLTISGTVVYGSGTFSAEADGTINY